MNCIRKSAATVTVALAGLLAFSSCNCGKQISGTLDDAGNDSLAVFIYNARTNDLAAADTIVARNGKIAVSFKDTAAVMVYVTPFGQQGSMAAPVLVLPGEKVKVSGTLSDPVYSGTEIYDGLAVFEDFKKLENKFDDAIYNYLYAYWKEQSGEYDPKKDVIPESEMNKMHPKTKNEFQFENWLFASGYRSRVRRRQACN